MSIKLTFAPAQPKKIGTVFIIEDNPLELEMISDYFERYKGIVVKGFPTGDECIKEVVRSAVAPDMILVDYFLDSEIANSKDGLEVLVKLKEICPQTAIIMHTSVENQRIVDLARQKGAMNYIVKGAAGFEKLDAIIRDNFIMDAPAD
jgi:DNA-binding NarL/FixJ family response regulator